MYLFSNFGVIRNYELNPVYYYNKRRNASEFGFIAHEVDDIFPDLVHGIKDDANMYQNINYIGLIPLCVNEIKKMKTTIDILTDKLSQAINRIDILESK